MRACELTQTFVVSWRASRELLEECCNRLGTGVGVAIQGRASPRQRLFRTGAKSDDEICSVEDERGRERERERQRGWVVVVVVVEGGVCVSSRKWYRSLYS